MAARSSPNIAVASWGEGIVGTSSHALHDKGVISPRGVEREVKSSKDMYPSIKPKTPDPNKNTELYTGFATVTPITTQPDKEQAAITIQRYFSNSLIIHQVKIKETITVMLIDFFIIFLKDTSYFQTSQSILGCMSSFVFSVFKKY